MGYRKLSHNVEKPTDEMIKLLKDSASNDTRVAFAAQRQILEQAQAALREGILDGDIVGNAGIFTVQDISDGQPPEWPLDFVVPGTEAEYAAYTVPGVGYIPEKHVDGDYVTIGTYDVAAAIDFSMKFAKNGRWDVVARALQVLELMFVKKMNLDAWKCLIAAAVDRNVKVADSLAPAGFLTKRLISLMKTTMQRAGGGNLTSLNPITLTDVFMSPENIEDARSWDLTQVDDATRRVIYNSGQALSGLFGVNIHPLMELGQTVAGASFTFQAFYESLGGTYGSSDTELVIGLDLGPDSATTFISPVKQDVEIFPDENLHRQRRQGYYGWREHGFGVLDNRRVIIGTN